MNELVKFEQTETAPSVYSDINLYEQAFKMAESLSRTDLVPDNYKNKPENCLIAIDVSRQIGARSPLFIMQNLYVVKGKPSWSGQYCVALVRANFKDVRIEWRDNDNDDGYGCRVVARDKNDHGCIGTWVTMKMAKKEGWIDKTGSKWQTMPVQMLQYRAFAFFARVHCPEKLLGMSDEFESQDIAAQFERSEQAKNLEEKLLEAEVIND